MKPLFCIALALILHSSDSFSQKTNTGEIRFGEGGGFTGSVKEYVIKSNGDLYTRTTEDKEYNKVKTLRKSELRNIRRKLKRLSSKSLQFNHPWNIYYFIESERGKITWGDPAFPAPAEVTQLYAELKALVNS